jgi:hypothetical protein
MPGKKFPDLTGDGKVTKKDILKARGVPGFKEGGKVRGTKKKGKEEKELSIDPLNLANPKPKSNKPMEPKLENRRAPKIKPPRPKAFKEGGMVLEIGLRPATKQEMKMAKEMKPQKKANGGMVARGTGQAIRGKGFKGVF